MDGRSVYTCFKSLAYLNSCFRDLKQEAAFVGNAYANDLFDEVTPPPGQNTLPMIADFATRLFDAPVYNYSPSLFDLSTL